MPSQNRRSVRLPNYDYASPGVYFVTLCTHGRRFFFNRGQIRFAAEACWLAIPQHNPNVTLDEWVLMPNHLHGLIEIHENNGQRGRGVQLNAPTTDNNDFQGVAPLHADTARSKPGDVPSEGDADHRRGVQLNAPTATNHDLQGPSLLPGDNDGSTSRNRFSAISPRAGTLSVILRTYKAAVTTACRKAGYARFAWQHNFYDHVVRNRRELDVIRRYIHNNPVRWGLDRDNPANKRKLPPPLTIADYLADLGLD